MSTKSSNKEDKNYNNNNNNNNDKERWSEITSNSITESTHTNPDLEHDNRSHPSSQGHHEHENDQLFHEKEQLQRQYHKLKQQCESLNHNKLWTLIKNQELVKMTDVEGMKQEVSRQLRELNAIKSEEEEGLYSKSPSNTFSNAHYNTTTNSHLLLNDVDYNHNYYYNNNNNNDMLQLSQKTISETDSLHSKITNCVDAFQEYVLKEFDSLQNATAAFSDQQERQKEINEKEINETENMIEEINHKLESNNSMLKKWREENRFFLREIKEYKDQMQKVNSQIDDQKEQLAIFQKSLEHMQNGYTAKLKAKELEESNLKRTIEELERILQERENAKVETIDKYCDMNREKNEYIREQSKEMEKELEKESQCRLELQKRYTQEEKRLRNLTRYLEKEKHTTFKLEHELHAQQTQLNETLKINEKLEKNIQNIQQNQKAIIEECEQMQAKWQEMKKHVDQLTESNLDLHKDLREKAEVEKKYKDREKQIIEREKKLQKAQKNISTKLPSSSDINKNKTNKLSRRQHRFSIEPIWDPLYQYRTLFPFPWLCVVLFLLLFFSLMFNQRLDYYS